MTVAEKSAEAFDSEWATLVAVRPRIALMLDKEVARSIFDLGFSAGVLAYPEILKQPAIGKTK